MSRIRIPDIVERMTMAARIKATLDSLPPAKHDLLASPQVNQPFAVVHRNPPLQGDPEWVVYAGERHAESVGHFFSQMDAQNYADWRNRKSTHEPKNR